MLFGDERLPERIWSRITVTSGGCWLWSGALNVGGYPVAGFGKKVFILHRYIRGLLEPLWKGSHCDHLCRVPRCVNPAHTEQVSAKANQNRGLGSVKGKRTHCPLNHEMSGSNRYVCPKGYVYCIECRRRRQRTYKEKQR